MDKRVIIQFFLVVFFAAEVGGAAAEDSFPEIMAAMQLRVKRHRSAVASDVEAIIADLMALRSELDMDAARLTIDVVRARLVAGLGKNKEDDKYLDAILAAMDRMGDSVRTDFSLKLTVLVRQVIRELVEAKRSFMGAMMMSVVRQDIETKMLLFKEVSKGVPPLNKIDFYPSVLTQLKEPEDEMRCAFYALYNALCEVNKRAAAADGTLPDRDLTFMNRDKLKSLLTIWIKIVSDAGGKASAASGGITHQEQRILLNALIEGKAGISNPVLLKKMEEHVVMLDSIASKTAESAFIDLEYMMRNQNLREVKVVEAFKRGAIDYLIILYDNITASSWNRDFGMGFSGHATTLVFSPAAEGEGKIDVVSMDSSTTRPHRDFVKILYRGCLKTEVLPKERQLARMMRIVFESVTALDFLRKNSELLSFPDEKGVEFNEELAVFIARRNKLLNFFDKAAVSEIDAQQESLLREWSSFNPYGEIDTFSVPIVSSEMLKALKACKDMVLLAYGGGSPRLKISSLSVDEKAFLKKLMIIYMYMNNLLQYKQSIEQMLKDLSTADVRETFRQGITKGFGVIPSILTETVVEFLEDWIVSTFVPFLSSKTISVSGASLAAAPTAASALRPASPLPAKLVFTPIVECFNSAGRKHAVGWFGAEGDDKVLISVVGGGVPLRDNFIYINPDYPFTALPEGLFYWEKQGDVENYSVGIDLEREVKHQPSLKGWKYSGVGAAGASRYADGASIWDPSKNALGPRGKILRHPNEKIARVAGE